MEEEIMKNTEIWVTKFDEEHAKLFREQVLSVSKMDPTRPVVIYIDSYGGYVDALAKMIETLDEIPNPIVTACLGKAMSCGAILLSHGDVRFLGKHSRIMIHEVSSGAGGNIQDMKDDVKESVRLNDHFIGLLAKNCGFKNYDELREVLKQQDGRDLYLTGDAALKFGIIDAVGTPRISGRMMYEVGKQATRSPFESRNKQSIRTAGRLKPKLRKKRVAKRKSETKKRK